MQVMKPFLGIKSSPLGEMILIGSIIGNKVHRYDITTFTLRQSYTLTSLSSVSPGEMQGRIVVDPVAGAWFAITNGQTVGVYDMDSGAELYYNGSYGGLIDVNPAGTYLAIVNSTNVALVDTSTWIMGSALATTIATTPGMRWSPNGVYLAVSSSQGWHRVFTHSGATLSYSSTGFFTSSGSNKRCIIWFSDNNFFFQNSQSVSSEECGWCRRSTSNTLAQTNQVLNAMDTHFYDHKTGSTSAESLCIHWYKNPNVEVGLRRITSYTGATIKDAFTEDGASYPTASLQSMTLSQDRTRGFYAGRIDATHCNVYEFNPDTMFYVGLKITTIGGQAEDEFTMMATFNPDA